MAKLPEDYVLEDYVIRYFSIDLEGKTSTIGNSSGLL